MFGACRSALSYGSVSHLAAAASVSGAHHETLVCTAVAAACARRRFTGGLLRRHAALTENKEGLSSELDAAVAAGSDPHKFSVGFWSSCQSREEYTRFMLSHYFFYGALERAFDAQPPESHMARLWRACPELRGAPRKLERDLRFVGVDGTSAAPSPAAANYVAAVEEASADGAELVGHFYCRYFADLFGGSTLGQVARLSIGLPRGRPEFYEFPAEVEENRAAYVEHLYRLLTVEGARMGPEARARAVEAAQNALALNAAIYAETTKRPLLGAVRGATNFACGQAAELLSGRYAASEESSAVDGLLLPTARRSVSPSWP
eukprot:TRINITY_DN76195_c0_g1_i1.p1 TRINITY_DN76195_c0_g1~~TRINITY_DN76195_c0_g1_i1.p1  ORF type:complete len:320 (+),score=54.07 TRINITY_DN76195_c0_g1_i1:58-1017(+)